MPDNLFTGLLGIILMGIAVLATVGLGLYCIAQLAPRGQLNETPARAGKTILGGFYIGLIVVGIVCLALVSLMLWGFRP